MKKLKFNFINFSYILILSFLFSCSSSKITLNESLKNNLLASSKLNDSNNPNKIKIAIINNNSTIFFDYSEYNNAKIRIFGNNLNLEKEIPISLNSNEKIIDFISINGNNLLIFSNSIQDNKTIILGRIIDANSGQIIKKDTLLNISNLSISNNLISNKLKNSNNENIVFNDYQFVRNTNLNTFYFYRLNAINNDELKLEAKAFNQNFENLFTINKTFKNLQSLEYFDVTCTETGELNCNLFYNFINKYKIESFKLIYNQMDSLSTVFNIEKEFKIVPFKKINYSLLELPSDNINIISNLYKNNKLYGLLFCNFISNEKKVIYKINKIEEDSLNKYKIESNLENVKIINYFKNNRNDNILILQKIYNSHGLNSIEDSIYSGSIFIIVYDDKFQFKKLIPVYNGEYNSKLYPFGVTDNEIFAQDFSAQCYYDGNILRILYLNNLDGKAIACKAIKTEDNTVISEGNYFDISGNIVTKGNWSILFDNNTFGYVACLKDIIGNSIMMYKIRLK